MLKLNIKISLLIIFVLFTVYCKRDTYTEPLNMKSRGHNYEYFDYINFKVVNKIAKIEYPYVCIDTLNNTLILNIYLNPKKHIKKKFRKKEGFFISQEITYESLDSVIHEYKVSVFLPHDKIIEYNFITDASNNSKLVLVKVIEKNYEKHYEPNENPNFSIDSIPTNVDDPISILENTLNVNFNATNYRYLIKGTTLYKIKENDEVVETYYLNGLNPFYKDYLQYIK